MVISISIYDLLICPSIHGVYGLIYEVKLLPLQPSGSGGKVEEEDEDDITIGSLLFAAEDPALFAKRVASAHRARFETPLLLSLRVILMCYNVAWTVLECEDSRFSSLKLALR